MKNLSTVIYLGFYNEKSHNWEKAKWFSKTSINQFANEFPQVSDDEYIVHDKIFENNFDDFSKLVSNFSFPHSYGYECVLLRDLKRVIDNYNKIDENYDTLVYIFRKAQDLVFDIYGITDLKNIRLIFTSE